MRGTEKYAHETNLSKRVGAWQEKLEPLMERRVAAAIPAILTFFGVVGVHSLYIRAWINAKHYQARVVEGDHPTFTSEKNKCNGTHRIASFGVKSASQAFSQSLCLRPRKQRRYDAIS